MIEVKNLTFSYSKISTLLNDISFVAKKGEIINILGPNGCGKSTLIKLILGFHHDYHGEILIDNQRVETISRKILAEKLSYVPQQHSGVFAYTVLDVVLMARLTKGLWYKYSSEDYDIAYASLKRLNILDYADRSYLRLSGGERQLVMIARALAQNNNYCVMDEPVAGLDYGNQFMLLETVKSLADEGMSFLVSTHHPEHALLLGGRSILIKNGTIISDGSSDNVVTTANICNLYDIQPETLEKLSSVRLS